MIHPQAMPEFPPQIDSPPATNARRFSTHRILSGMKIRKKLIVLHTAFSLGLGTILLIAIYPAMSKVIRGAEIDSSTRILEILLETGDLPNHDETDSDWVMLRSGDAVREVLDETVLEARNAPGTVIPIPPNEFASGVLCYLPATDEFVAIRSRSELARSSIQLVYVLVIVTLLVGYGLVAAALELFVLPQHVYGPISSMFQADRAVTQGERDHELIPDAEIPADELGSIMRSRNETIRSLRRHEHELARALDRLEHTAADLHKKNHLLETARKNLEGADRLASLGMMSAGIAHELNTPLAVVKGLVEKLNRDSELSLTEIALLVRVVQRLETLSEGLLDFARVRPPLNEKARLLELVSEAQMLVLIDRKEAAQSLEIEINSEFEEAEIQGDPDRLVQVFVNLIRNAIDALTESGTESPRIIIEFVREIRESMPWIAVRIIDNGPGIDSELIDRLFEPFVSTRLDAQGTGLGLAVANGIVREHGGILTATNRSGTGQRGAVFEVLLPSHQTENTDSV
jgi:signal transduction histidine kinase